MPTPIIDGDFTNPVEIQGSPSFALDEVTYARVITRRFAVQRNYYSPLPQATPDPTYKTALLVTEATDQIEGGIMFFRRVFAEMPATRTERRPLAFVIPGRSQVFYSSKTALPINWDKYGLAAPLNRLLLATSTFTYSLFAPTLVTNLTKIVYQGQEVDYAGPVYVPVGDVPIGGNQTEPRWQFQGMTNPQIAPTFWIVAVNARRWMGPIWETETVTVSTAGY